MPKKVEDFIKLKYNKDTSDYKRLNREYKTIGKISKNSTEVNRDIDTYYTFRKEKIEMTNHGIFDYYERMYDKKGNVNYTQDKIIEVIKKKSNYIDTRNERKVNYYDNIAIVKENITNEIVSIRKGRRSKQWKEI